MTTVMASLTPETRADDCIKHALAVRSAWALNNYHTFFKLYTNAPKMSGYLMDWFAEKLRTSAMRVIMKSYVIFQSTPTFLFMNIELMFSWGRGILYYYITVMILALDHFWWQIIKSPT